MFDWIDWSILLGAAVGSSLGYLLIAPAIRRFLTKSDSITILAKKREWATHQRQLDRIEAHARRAEINTSFQKEPREKPREEPQE